MATSSTCLKSGQSSRLSPTKLRSIIKTEMDLTYGFVKSNLDASFVPVLSFTLASTFHRGLEPWHIPRIMAGAMVYAFLYAFNIDIANNIAGSQEDQVNKPDRPLVTGSCSIRAAKVRYLVYSAMYVLYSMYMGVLTWSALWMLTIFCSYVLETARFGPAKDVSMCLGTVAQLTAAWIMGGSSVESGWEWVQTISCGVLFTVSIQDFRDVPGDRARRRLTMPILLGRLYNTLSLAMFEGYFIRTCVLKPRTDVFALLASLILVVTTAVVILRVLLLRSLRQDELSYRWYSTLYNFEVLAACVSMRPVAGAASYDSTRDSAYLLAAAVAFAAILTYRRNLIRQTLALGQI